MSKILDTIYIWVFLVNSKSVLNLALLNMCCIVIVLKTVFFFGTFWRLKTLVLWRKFFHNLLIFAYLFCSKNKTIDSGKTSITLAWLVVESCPTPRWITFLMLYRLMYNIRSYFNDLILAWSTYWDSFWQLKALKKWWKMMCFILKHLFVLNTFKFLPWLFDHVEHSL